MKIFIATLAMALLFITESAAAYAMDYRAEMAGLVSDIASYARLKHPGFIILANGGASIYKAVDGNTEKTAASMLDVVDGVMAESVNYGWDMKDGAATPADERAYFLKLLKAPKDAGKAVFVLDYVKNEREAVKAYDAAAAEGFTGWSSYDRELSEIPQMEPEHANDRSCHHLHDARNYMVLLNPEKYLTQEEYISALASTDYDVLIIDLYYDGSSLPPNAVKRLKQKKGGASRLVLAYMSVGEAEDYRPYWDQSWQRHRPSWIADKNKDWQGSSKVRYWYPEWRKILYGSTDAYLDQIIASGFDGAFLDVVDAYEYFIEQERK